ncbi:MAG TPA: carbamate kinase [Terriglobales bacterium]|nr:carbamate kinase [Terriglobales bacterium]
MNPSIDSSEALLSGVRAHPTRPEFPRTALIAIGGNSLIRAGEQGSVAEELANIRHTAAAIIGLIRNGYRLVITHGNGPQVGAALLRSERAAGQAYSQPLDVCDADTQGEIGYLLQQSLKNELSRAGLSIPVVSVVTQCVVDRNDPAMQRPTKPVGPFYSRAEAEERRSRLGWQIVADAARGYRRVVPSPEPVEVVELEAIRRLIDQGVLVIAAGGGGIPVVRECGVLKGVEAVIDKDRASALLASGLGLDLFAICTDEDFVYLDYARPTQRPLFEVTASELEAYRHAGHFPPGSMGPKIESALRFLRAGGKEVIITSYQHLCCAVAGSAGTHIVGDPLPRDDQLAMV